jgi:hypothetical protein
MDTITFFARVEPQFTLGGCGDTQPRLPNKAPVAVRIGTHLDWLPIGWPVTAPRMRREKR